MWTTWIGRTPARGIPVANVPDYGSEEVADAGAGHGSGAMRGVHFLNSTMQDGQGPWSPLVVAPLDRLRGTVCGIIGLGRIGSAAALRAKAFGLDVCFYDPYKPDGYDKALGIRRCETLDQLLSASQVVSLHCPLTDETRHMLWRGDDQPDAAGQLPDQHGAWRSGRHGLSSRSHPKRSVGGSGD